MNLQALVKYIDAEERNLSVLQSAKIYVADLIALEGHEKTLAARVAEVERIGLDAQHVAEQKVNSAMARAAGIMAQAQKDADRQKAIAEQAVVAFMGSHQKERDVAVQELQALRDEYAATHSKLMDMHNELARAEKQLHAARTAIASVA